MSSSARNEICLKCGEELKYTSESIAVPCLARAKKRWGSLEKASRTTNSLIEILVEESGVSIDAVTEYVNHAMGHGCKKKIRNCPACGNQLRTWRAKMCLECGAEFEPLFPNK
jgi:predicted amidophosphoribosyltransferase